LTIYIGVDDMSKRISKTDLLPYEEDLVNNRYLLTIQEGDVTGDGVSDKVYLYGNKIGDSVSSFVDNISIVIEDGYSGETNTITPDFNAGYNPRLFLGDFTADNVEDIKLSIDSGGSGGYGYFYIYTCINNTPKEIFNFDQYNALYQYKVDFTDLYRVEVYNMNHDKLFVLDVSYKGDEYVSQYYDEFGMLIIPIQGDVLAVSALMPFVQNEEVNAYELLAYQRIIGPINSDTLGYIENVLSWDGEEFVSTRMSAVIPGLLLNPPVI
jgi:hypothetical protein